VVIPPFSDVVCPTGSETSRASNDIATRDTRELVAPTDDHDKDQMDARYGDTSVVFVARVQR